MNLPAASQTFALDIPGTWNARDIGGRATPRGADRPLATGVLLRTASLARVTDEGLNALRTLGVTTVCDLRSDEEISRDGADRVPETTEVHRRPMNPTTSSKAGKESADTAGMVGQLISAEDPAALARTMMLGVYSSFTADSVIRAQVGTALADIADSKGAALVHCAAGKDRTGWIVALVQYLCGVDDDDRMAEYLASAAGAAALAETFPTIPGLNPDALMPLLTVEPDYLASAWTAAADEFGSMDAYLQACGVTDATRTRLGERFAG